MRLKSISLLLITALLAITLAGTGCGHKKAATPDPVAEQQAAIVRLNKLKGEAQRLISYTNMGVKAVRALKDQPGLPKIPQLDEAIELASSGLDEIQKSSDAFFELMKTFSALDLTSKAALLEAFNKILAQMDIVLPALERIANLVVAYLNSKHVTNIDLTNLQRNCDLARSVLDGSVRIVQTFLQ